MSLLSGMHQEFEGYTIECASCGVKRAYRNFYPLMHYFGSGSANDFEEKEQTQIAEENNRLAKSFCKDKNTLKPEDFFDPIEGTFYCKQCVDTHPNLTELRNNSVIESRAYPLWKKSKNTLDSAISKELQKLRNTLKNVLNTYDYSVYNNNVISTFNKNINKLSDNVYIQNYIGNHSKYILSKVYGLLDTQTTTNAIKDIINERIQLIENYNKLYDDKYKFIDKCLKPIQKTLNLLRFDIPKNVEDNDNRRILCAIKPCNDNEYIAFETLKMYQLVPCKITKLSIENTKVNLRSSICNNDMLCIVKQHVRKQVTYILEDVFTTEAI